MQSFSSEKKMDMKGNFIFMYDNDAKRYYIPYQNVDTGILKSPVINSIENGNFLARKLKDALLKKWNEIQPHITSNFANLISKRIAVIIKSEGYPRKY